MSTTEQRYRDSVRRRDEAFRATLIERVRMGATRDEVVNNDLAYMFDGQRVREFVSWADWADALAASAEPDHFPRVN